LAISEGMSILWEGGENSIVPTD